jgi:RimJ/RimL family protein N-acetyltransferase
VLRQWRDADLEPFATLNADPEVMRHFPALLTRQAERCGRRARENADHGARMGLWAAELVQRAEFIGFVGLAEPRFDAHFTAAVEVGWRLAREHWGSGYATEGARAAIAFAFDELGLDEVVSFTTVGNERSRRVMERLGMSYDAADDFEHPLLAHGDPLRPHVLYRLGRTRAWPSESPR